MTRPCLLVDGDLIAHRAAEAFTVSEPLDEHGDLWRYETDVKQAMARFMDDVASFRSELGCDEVVVAFSTQPNWRLQVLPSYKSNRKSSRKPPGFAALKDRIRGHSALVVVEKPTLEGDDILGILATETRGILEAKERILWSDDKDMRGIPCTLVKTNGIPVEITEDEADLWHLVQTLSGDVTDGYKGCPGIGVVNAERLLADLEPARRWEAVVQRYAKEGLTEKDALVQARVARICRASDYNFDTKEVILWQPS